MIVSIKSNFLSHKDRRPGDRRPNVLLRQVMYDKASPWTKPGPENSGRHLYASSCTNVTKVSMRISDKSFEKTLRFWPMRLDNWSVWWGDKCWGSSDMLEPLSISVRCALSRGATVVSWLAEGDDGEVVWVVCVDLCDGQGPSEDYMKFCSCQWSDEKWTVAVRVQHVDTLAGKCKTDDWVTGSDHPLTLNVTSLINNKKKLCDLHNLRQR